VAVDPVEELLERVKDVDGPFLWSAVGS